MPLEALPLELSQLRYFLKVAERLNFTRAAEDLQISQPALSRAIGKLEEELGQPLLERQPRRLSLTEAGKLLHDRADRILALVENTKAEIRDDTSSGSLRVGAIPTIAPYFLPGLLQEFTRACPSASVVVQEDITERTLKQCADGEIDLALVALPIVARYVEVEELFEEELLLVLPPEHPLTTKKRIRVSDVEPFPFVLLDEAHCLTGNIESFCHQKSFRPVAVERTSQLTTVQELVSLDHGVSMIPAMARVVDESHRRVYRSLSGTKPMRKIALVWNPYRFQSKLLERFKQHVRDYAAQFRVAIEAHAE